MCRPVAHPDDAPRGDRKAEEAKQPGDLGSRDPALLVQHHRQGHRPGTEVAGGGPEGHRGLGGMAPTSDLVAAAAASPAHPVAAVVHPPPGGLLLLDAVPPLPPPPPPPPRAETRGR